MDQLNSRNAIEVTDEPVVEELRAEDRKVTRSRWIVAGLVAVVAIIAGVVALSGDDSSGGLEAVTPPEDSTTAAPTTTTTAAPTTTAAATFVADATPLTSAFSPVEAGTHRVDTVGTPFTFTIEEQQFVQPNGNGQFVLTDPGSVGPDDRDIVIMRLTTLSDPAEPTASLDEPGGGWPADDFGGWLDNLSDHIAVTNRTDTTLGGLDAIGVELELGETDCQLGGGPCITFGTNHGFTGKDLLPGSKYRIWMVDQQDEDPLAVIVGIDNEADADWFDTADTILSTLAFGEVGPNPILAAPAGPIELPFLGGIRTELAEDALAFFDPRGFGRIALEGQPADTEFLTNPLDGDGNPLDTADDVATALAAVSAEVTEIGTTSIAGLDARVFEIAGRSPAPALKLTPDSDGWRPPTRGRMWVVDHPDRGLLIITAEAFRDVDTVFPLVLDQTEQIIGTLEFVDLG